MATMTYKEQLLHPNWQRKRLEILQRDDFRCQLCGDDDSTLHVHHKQYGKGRLAWEYPNDELVTLCEPCHDTMHEQQGMLRDVTAKLPVDGPGCVNNGMAVLAGWAHRNQGLDFGAIFATDPHCFLAGEAAGQLEGKLGIDGLLDFRDGLIDAPPWVVQRAIAEASKILRDHADDPAPPGFGEPAL